MIDAAALRSAQSWLALKGDYPLIELAATTHRNLRREPMSFRDKPSLVEMYADFPTLDGADIQKAVQTGLSELITLLHLHAAGWKSRIAALVMPTHDLRNRFVQSRIDPLLDGIPSYRDRAGGVLRERGRKKAAENLKVKRFGDGMLLFLGANSPGDFVEFSTDIITIDEFDRCLTRGERNVAKARDRLRHSPYPQMFRVGNPSIPRFGISEAFNAGDRRQFHWRCDHCGERQPLDWFANFVRREDDGRWALRDRSRAADLVADPTGPDIRPTCRRCEEPFNRIAAGAAWIAASPGRRRSYRMSRLDDLSDRIYQLWTEEWVPAQRSKIKLAAFYSSVLGLPYEDAAAKLTHGALKACCTGEMNDWDGGEKYADELVVMGVDVGAVLNVTVDVIHYDEDLKSTYRRAAFICAVSSFAALRDIIKRYQVSVCVIDSKPETRKARELKEWALNDHPDCIVWLCDFFPTERVGADEYGLRVDYQAQVIRADRTQLLDATHEEIVQGRRVLPSDSDLIPDFFDQMQAPVRMLSPKGNRFIWSKGPPDHYRFSDSYSRLASDMANSGGGFVS